MKNPLFLMLNFLFLSLTTFAQGRVEMEKEVENSIDFLWLCVGVVIGVGIGYFVAQRGKK